MIKLPLPNPTLMARTLAPIHGYTPPLASHFNRYVVMALRSYQLLARFLPHHERLLSGRGLK